MFSRSGRMSGAAREGALALSGRARLLVSLVTIGVLAASFGVSSALAGEPANVTVRVEGFDGTLLPQTHVSTTTAPVPVEGGTCSGTSAGGALYDATSGDWEARSEPEGVAILGIDGLDLPPFGAEAYAYWAVWVNDEFAKQGACSEELGQGANVVFVGQCFAPGPECTTSTTAPDHFLISTPPTSTAVRVGEPVSITIGSLSTESGVREPVLPAGVAVTAGSTSATPNAQGVATLSFAAAGTYTLQAHAPDSAPSDPYTVCVHNGNDGTCGTQAPTVTAGGGVSASSTRSILYTGPYALVPHLTSVLNGRVYLANHAPRLLAGSVSAHSPVTSVSLRLRREYHHRCYAYDGLTTRFVKARCGRGSFFKVANGGSFSYLLPAALAPGRYVLDIEATDAAGNRTTLARGTSRVVFDVRR